MDSKGWENVASNKNKADKSDAAKDQETPAEPKISEDVVDAEIVEEISKDADLSDTDTEAVQEAPVEAPVEDVAEDEPVTIEETENPTEGPEAEVSGEEIESEDTSAQETADTQVEAPVKAEAAPVKKTGFVQVALGGAVAAALGFGLSQYVGPLSGQKDEALIQLEAAVKAQSEQIETLLAQQSDAKAALASAQQALAATTSNIEGLTGAVAAANGRVDDVAGALGTLDGRMAVMEKNPITQSLPSAAIKAYEREVEELKEAVATQRAEAASMEENAKLTAQQALARAALSRVLSALDSGGSYRVALTDFSAATGTATPSELEAYADDGVTSLAELQNEFPGFARLALAAARADEQADANKLTSFFKAQLGARSVTPQDGDGADAILSRAEAALRAGRVTDSLAELKTLPEAAQAEVAPWVAKAQARQAAFAAGEALSQTLNTN